MVLAATNAIRAYGISNKLMHDGARAISSKILSNVVEEVFSVHITKLPPIVTPTAASRTRKTVAIPT